MALEQEVKLLVNGEDKLDLSLLQGLSVFSQDEPYIEHLVSTYYDTPELLLSQQHLGLRMRRVNERYLQTVKTSGTVTNGLHQREEWEYELARSEWDLSTLRLTPLIDMIDKPEIWSTLMPLFTTDFFREIVQLTLVDGTQVELAYDHGEVIAGELRSKIHEIELELKSGDSEQLASIADLICQQFDLTLSDTSKAKMGYNLFKKINND